MKRLLLIIPSFYSYEDKIISVLENKGFLVDTIYENLEEKYFRYRLIKRFSETFIETIYTYYYINKVKNKEYDILLAIRASSLNPNIIQYLKRISPNIKLYMYQWDSVKNNPNALKIASFFDKVSTFDMLDAKQYQWHYRPLFYTEETKQKENKYDIAFIATLHSRRLNIYRSLQEYKKLRAFLYLVSEKKHYYKQKYLLRNKDFIGLNDREVMFKPLPLSSVNKILSESRVVVDYTHPEQAGFTMRTCEAIGHRCKIVTNNRAIVNADFYNCNNVLIYDEFDFHIPNKFFKDDYQELSKEIYSRYSIDSFIEEILEL